MKNPPPDPDETRSAPAAQSDPSSQHQMLESRDARLESMTFLVGKLTHDFNNILLPILGYAALIREEPGCPPSVLDHLDKMEAAARKSEKYLETIFMATRPGRRFTSRPFDLAAATAAVLDEWEAALLPAQRVGVRRALAPAPFLGDEKHWRRLVLELLNNARFGLAIGGELEVTLQPVADEQYELVVRDNGFGISPENQRRVFEPFFTTRPRGQALGLGLTIVYGVARLHGGQAVLESSEDSGTVVTVRVPRAGVAEVESAPRAMSGRRAALPGQGAKRVLLVEDDPLVREVIKTYLQKLPLEVLTAEDGSQGLALFEKNIGRLALVVSDIMMPNMGGAEFYRRLRQLDAQVPVILMSGNSDAVQGAWLDDARESPPLLLSKPFTLKAFTEIVRSRLMER